MSNDRVTELFADAARLEPTEFELVLAAEPESVRREFNAAWSRHSRAAATLVEDIEAAERDGRTKAGTDTVL